MTIDVVPLRSETSRQTPRTTGQRRAEMFRSSDHPHAGGDDIVRAARSLFAAIERALSKVIRDPELRRSVLSYAMERIARELERGGEFKRANLREQMMHRQPSPQDMSNLKRQQRSNPAEVHRER